jgi:hypothetical protein
MADGTRTKAPSAKSWRSWFGRVWPLATTLAIFAAIFSRIPFSRLSEALSQADLLPFLALMASFSLTFFAIDTLVLTLAIRWFHGPLPYRELLPVRASTYLVSLVNTQLAQGALALYLHRRFRTPLLAITGTVLVMILLEVTQLIVFATAGMLAFPGTAPASLLGVPAALAVLWAVLVLFVRRPARGAVATHAVTQTLRIAAPRQLLALLGLKSTTFLLALLVHGLALSLFDIHIPWSRLLGSLPIVFMVAALPITVAHLGTSQAAWIFFFHDYAPEASLLAYSLAAHLTFMLANGTLGLLFLPKAYVDLVLRPGRDEAGGERPSQKATSV